MANADTPGARIAEALKAAGMKPVELARALSVSQPTVHGWVNQLHGISWENARRVAGALKVAPGWIMFGADEEAERVAQTSEELGFLRLFREFDDADHASLLRLMGAMKQRPPTSPTASPLPKAKGRAPPLPFPVGGNVKENRVNRPLLTVVQRRVCPVVEVEGR